MISILGTLTYQDIGPGKYELVTPTLTYNLAADPTVKTILDQVVLTNKEAQVRVYGQKIGGVATVGGTNKQTIVVSKVELS
jgi:hypothetical protein